ncbi:MAG: AbrB/MazE/SpoVT family DNA-binding domain-containing protein [Desulfovibrionaceae bacterium]
MPLVTIRRKHQLTIPGDIRKKLHLAEGDQVEVREEGGNIIMTPVRAVPRDQAWYWTPEWQAKEREADEDIAAGRTYGSFSSVEEMRAHLDRLSDADDSE